MGVCMRVIVKEEGAIDIFQGCLLVFGVFLDEPTVFQWFIAGVKGKACETKNNIFVLTNALFFSLGCTEN